MGNLIFKFFAIALSKIWGILIAKIWGNLTSAYNFIAKCVVRFKKLNKAVKFAMKDQTLLTILESQKV